MANHGIINPNAIEGVLEAQRKARSVRGPGSPLYTAVTAAGRIQTESLERVSSFAKSVNTDSEANAKLINDSLGRLKDINSYGALSFIPELLAAFGDTDYSEDFQKTNITQAQEKIRQNDRRINAIKEAEERKRRVAAVKVGTEEVLAQQIEAKEKGLEGDVAFKAQQRLIEQNKMKTEISNLGKAGIERELANTKSKYPRGLLQAIHRSEETADVALSTAKILEDRQEFSLSEDIRKSAVAQKKVYLNTRTSAQLLDMANKAKGTTAQVVSVNGVKFTAAEVNTAYTASIKAEVAQRTEIGNLAASQLGIPNIVRGVQNQTANLNRLTGEVNQQMASNAAVSEAEIAARARLGDMAGAKKKAEAYKSDVAKKIDAQIAAYEKSQQPAAREFVNTGRVVNPANAANYLSLSATNPNFISKSSIYGNSAALFNSRLLEAKAARRVLTLSKRDLKRGLPIGKGPSAAEEINTVIANNPKVKQTALADITMRHFKNTIVAMQTDTPLAAQIGVGNVHFSNIYNPSTGRFNAEFLDENGDLSTTAIINGLVKKETFIKKQTGQSLDLVGMLLSKAAESEIQAVTLDQIRQNQNIEESSFETLIMGRTPLGHIATKLNALERIARQSRQAIAKEEAVGTAKDKELAAMFDSVVEAAKTIPQQPAVLQFVREQLKLRPGAVNFVKDHQALVDLVGDIE